MYIVDGKIVSAEIFSNNFICNLSACKGACCWEGDFGAPVTDIEEEQIKEIIEIIIPLLSQDAIQLIRDHGIAPIDPVYKGKVTPILKDGTCAYLVKDKNGIGQCSFELLWKAGKTTFRKPISCHLYPIRISENKKTDFEALNFDQWNICKAACTLGDKEKMPVFRFTKEAIIRRYGQEFYGQLEDIYQIYFS